MTSGRELISWLVPLQFDRSRVSAQRTVLQEGNKKCFSYRFQGPRGHDTYSAHNWLCKTSAQAGKRITLWLLWWEKGGIPFSDWNIDDWCSAHYLLLWDRDRDLPTDIFFFKERNRANMLRDHIKEIILSVGLWKGILPVAVCRMGWKIFN